MLLPKELTEQILDRDNGTCRDVNFDGLDWDGAIDILDLLLGDASSAGIMDGNDQVLDIAGDGAIEICRRARETGSCHVLLMHVDELFHRLQAFVCPKEDGSPFLELTFFPDDLFRAAFSSEKLINKLVHLSTLGRSKNFYLRYENANWKPGSTGQGTGVITTWRELRNAQ